MPDGPWPYIILIFLIIIGAFFAASETAFSSCNRVKLRVKADNGNKSASLAEKIATKFDQYLVAILIGTNIVSVLTSLFATYIFRGPINDVNTASIVATVVTTIVVYIFVESIPKCIGRAWANGFAIFSARILLVFYYITLPIGIIFTSLSKLFNYIFHVKNEPEITETDFTNIIDDIEDKGLLEEEESDIIQSAFDFGETKVKEVLTPVSKMYAINIKNLNHDKLNEILLNTPYTRIPFYSGNIDNIIGILHVKKYLAAYLKNKKVSIRAVLSHPYIVSNNFTMEKLFEGFKKHKTHVAIVKDRNGKTLGMVTMEDLLEELVGDVSESNLETPRKKGGKK